MHVLDVPKIFIFRQCCTTGLRNRTLNGKNVPGYKINVHIKDPKEFQDYWSSLNPHKETILFGSKEKFLCLNDSDIISLTISPQLIPC